MSGCFYIHIISYLCISRLTECISAGLCTNSQGIPRQTHPHILSWLSSLALHIAIAQPSWPQAEMYFFCPVYWFTFQQINTILWPWLALFHLPLPTQGTMTARDPWWGKISSSISGEVWDLHKRSWPFWAVRWIPGARCYSACFKLNDLSHHGMIIMFHFSVNLMKTYYLRNNISSPGRKNQYQFSSFNTYNKCIFLMLYSQRHPFIQISLMLAKIQQGQSVFVRTLTSQGFHTEIMCTFACVILRNIYIYSVILRNMVENIYTISNHRCLYYGLCVWAESYCMQKIPSTNLLFWIPWQYELSYITEKNKNVNPKGISLTLAFKSKKGLTYDFHTVGQKKKKLTYWHWPYSSNLTHEEAIFFSQLELIVQYTIFCSFLWISPFLVWISSMETPLLHRAYGFYVKMFSML